MKGLFALGLLFLLMPSEVAAETGFLNRVVTLDGVEYRYQVYVPPGYQPSTAWPIVLALHGGGERGSDGLLQTDVGLARAIRRNPARFPAVVVFPQVPLTGTPGWQALGGRIALAALDRAMAEFRGDPARVYLTGLSMGGNGSWYLAYNHPERFAAVVVVCGFVTERSGTSGIAYPAIAAEAGADPFEAVARRVARLPVRIFHGDADRPVPVEESRRMAAALRQLGADVAYTEFPGVGHNAWDPAYEQAALFEWLFAQRRSASQAAVQPPAPVIKPVADGVHIFEYRGYQSMFVVDPGGVLVTDPMNLEAAKVFLAEIRRMTQAPIRYVVYSHHHYDHIAGGAPFKEAGATFVAHRNAKPQLERLKNPAIVLPDRVVDDHETLTVGRTRVELHHLGRNHSDNSLVIAVPAQKAIYPADWLPLGELIWRNIFDSYIDEWFAGIDRVLALDWDRLVVGHARAHNPKGWGTKDDVRAFKQYFTDLKEAVRVAYLDGKCPDRAPTEVKLPKYEQLFQYGPFLPMNVDRMCLYWRNGWQ